MRDPLDSDIQYVKGIGQRRAELLKKELGIVKTGDLLYHFPSHYLDRRNITKIRDLVGEEISSVQLQGHFLSMVKHGEGAKTRLIGLFTDGTATIEVVWFKKIKDLTRIYQLGKDYIIYGGAKRFNQHWSMVHPEIDVPESATAVQGMRSVYPLTDKLRKAGITSRTILSWIKNILDSIPAISEVLPEQIIRNRHLYSRDKALRAVHFPVDHSQYTRARERMKYEELFFLELNILRYSKKRNRELAGYRFSVIGQYFNNFYHNFLPFPLTDAQKRVLKEIRLNVNTGRHMNRLLQGDVGSGKTIVALLTMLMALDNGYQACLMAPTEILASQHYDTIRDLVARCGVSVALLTGSTKTKERDDIHSRLQSGELKILIGTHALLEDVVKFSNLGLAIIDEQHRFGVVQRSKIWSKNLGKVLPHVLVMTATPIPRTLAMTVYGDLDVSVIDKLPPGRKPVNTLLRYEENRQQIYRAVGEQLRKGRQVYIVYPLIEESEKLDLKSLEEGFETIKDTFPSFKVAMVHGRMKQAEKDYQMKRFVEGEAHILVATTVIEVGVNVPNASTMIIENAERFGLSQLHQLRGRVGRGAEQSYCILMSKYQIAKETRQRLEIMTSTTDGFIVAEADLKMRGPGDIEGTLQSGIPFNLKIASLASDGQIIQIAREDASGILDEDPELSLPINKNLLEELIKRNPKEIDFSRIS